MWCKLLNGGAHFRVWMLFPGLVFIFCIYQSPLIQTTGKSRKQQDTGKGWLRGSVWKMEASGNGLLVKEKTPTSRWHFRDLNLQCQEKITRKEVFEEVAEFYVPTLHGGGWEKKDHKRLQIPIIYFKTNQRRKKQFLLQGNTIYTSKQEDDI